MRSKEFESLLSSILHLWDNSVSVLLWFLGVLLLVIGGGIAIGAAKTGQYEHVHWGLLHLGLDIVYGGAGLVALGPVNTGIIHWRDRKPDKLTKHQKIIKHNKQLERKLLELDQHYHHYDD